MSPRNGSDLRAAPPAPASVVVIHDSRTPTERRLITRHAHVTYGADAILVGRDDDWIAADLHDDAHCVPARVVWVTPNTRSQTSGDLLAHLTPRRPWRPIQPLIARNSSGITVVEGDPATIGTLRARFGEDRAEWATVEDFIHHLATLACDRAERRLVGDRYKVPRNIADEIVADAGFREQLKALSRTTNRAFGDILDEAKHALTGIVAVQSPAAIDAYRTILAPMHARAWNVHVDTETLEPLRKLNREKALVFLPAHRSYVDPLVLGEVLHDNDFPRNHILGGNNMAIWPIGPLGRRAGVVWIRRSNADDRVYKLALREYLAHLVEKRFNLEWYIEGGRTRTGKLRPPKLGLLSYLSRAVTSGRTDDLLLVPVSMVYDHAHEVLALADEQAGGTKATEGPRWLARYVRAQLTNRGNAWVRFGEPFSLRDALDDAGPGPVQLEKVGFRICDGINRATPITPTALLTFALLGADDRAQTIGEIRRITDPLLDYFEQRDVPLCGDDLRTDRSVGDTLANLVSVGVATTYAGGPDQVWGVHPGRHTVAAFYRNGAIHHLVTRAIVEMSLLHVADSVDPGDPVDAAWAEALRLRSLLQFEFFFPPTVRFRDDVVAELELLDPEWHDYAGNVAGAVRVLQRSEVFVAHRCLRTFFDAQLVVASVLTTSTETLDDATLVKKCLGLGEQMLRQGRLHRADSVSRDLYLSALELARHRGLLDVAASAKRDEYAATVSEVLVRLNTLRTIEGKTMAGEAQ